MTLSVMLSIFTTLVIAGLVFWMFWWFLGYIGLPEPFNKVARVLLGLFAMIFLISLLVNGPSHPWLVNWR